MHQFLKLLFVAVVLFSISLSNIFLQSKNEVKISATVTTVSVKKENIAIANNPVTPPPNYRDVSNIVVPFADFGLASISDTKRDLLRQGEDFVEVDLNKMEIFLYKNGQVYKNFPVLSKGREGSWWETPTGKYTALLKEQNHFSSIGKVWMPYSVQFYGNFFIHGWPYYPNGDPVSGSYSGGCIRLSQKAAKEVFEFTQPNTPILIFDGDAETNNFSYSYSNPNRYPDVSARAFLVADLDSRNIIAFKNHGSVVPIASLTKLMTAVVASELINLDRSITVTDAMLLPNGETPGLIAGKRFKAFDLLYPLMMVESNDAAEALSYFIGKNRFVDAMNKKAESLAMTNSSFADVSGISSNNTATVSDILKLIDYITDKRKFILDISKGKVHSVFGQSEFTGLSNHNHFSNYDEFLGGTVGYSSLAQETMASVWNLVSNGGQQRKIAIIVLGSQNRQADTLALFNWVRYNN